MVAKVWLNSVKTISSYAKSHIAAYVCFSRKNKSMLGSWQVLL